MKKSRRIGIAAVAAVTMLAGGTTVYAESTAFRPLDTEIGVLIPNWYPDSSFAKSIADYCALIHPEADHSIIRPDNTYDVVNVSKYNIGLIKTSDNGTSILGVADDFVTLGESAGGLGVTSTAVADLNNDGWAEFYFAYSWDCGTYCSQVGYMDTKTEKLNYFDLCMCPDEELMFADDDGVLTLYTADVKDYTDKVHFSLEAKEKAAEIVCTEGEIQLIGCGDKIVQLDEPLVPPTQIEIPDWIPKSYDELIEFIGNKGKRDAFEIKGNVICYGTTIGGVLTDLGKVEFVDEESTITPEHYFTYNGKYNEDAHVLYATMQPGDYLCLRNTEAGATYPVLYFVCDSDGIVMQTEKGDVNGDSEVNVADLVTLHNWMLGRRQNIGYRQLADVCEDGEVNIFDTISLRSKVVAG